MNAKISVFVICVEAIIYLLLYNLHDCTFNTSYRETAAKRATLISFLSFICLKTVLIYSVTT